METNIKGANNRSNTHKRSIQPQQQKCKGVTRIVNGPKKNAVVTRINNRENKKLKEQCSSSTSAKSEKQSNVHERLFQQK